MPAKRLLLAAVPPLLAAIVRESLAGEPEVEVADAPGDPAGLSERIAATGARVVLAEASGAGLSDSLLELMYRHPRIRLLLVSPDGRAAAVYHLAPERRTLAATGPRALADAVRAAAAGA